MSKNNIWYLPGPFHRYQEDVKALAKEHGLVIVDANVAPNRNGEADDVPKVTIREGLRQAIVVVEADDPSRDAIDRLTAELASVGVIVESFAAQRLERPEGELGETAERLFQVLEAVNAGISRLQRERDGEFEKADLLQKQVDDLLAQAVKRENETEEDREAMDVAELKARLDEAGVTYRANASKESLQKLVAELGQQ
ncbi:hypothetical protein [Pseudomonas aeruginosa]|uniref:hypothetical protein n=1 Tax=Pseudomonas aeruginosa TaxID=287 RepID=UPI00071B4707|nr:hypothetical protein [Pseudomonas aeruginosa]AWQ84463.1 hypothetical protein CSC33_2260 [Pseudomonas aeruginosa]KSE30366.1 hypothetical protein AO916_20245 [Pseudomonas aeruginosa]MBG4980332.1 hypothetical protein [Pseudomonas aeruginosa]MBG6828174.1 hypothetical protein [Pseudomonas aeruginosa]MBH9176229.1 hypothetical protein [Pseudomonas aeruginosa]